MLMSQSDSSTSELLLRQPASSSSFSIEALLGRRDGEQARPRYCPAPSLSPPSILPPALHAPDITILPHSFPFSSLLARSGLCWPGPALPHPSYTATLFGKCRQPRTAYTSLQLLELEAEFKRSKVRGEAAAQSPAHPLTPLTPVTTKPLFKCPYYHALYCLFHLY